MTSLELEPRPPKEISLEEQQKKHRAFLIKSIVELDAELKKAKERARNTGQEGKRIQREMRDDMGISALFEGKNYDPDESEVDQIRRKLREYFHALEGHLKIVSSSNPNEPIISSEPKASGLVDPRNWQSQMTEYEIVLAEYIKDMRDALLTWLEAERNNKILLDAVGQKQVDPAQIHEHQQYAKYLQEKIEEKVAEIEHFEKQLLTVDIPGHGKIRH